MAENDTIEGTQVPAAPAKPEGRRVRIPLRTAIDCRRQLAKVYRQMYSGQLDPTVATKHCFVLMGIVKVIELAELTRQMDAFEERDKGRA